MINSNKKPRKSIFTHGVIAPLNQEEKIYCDNVYKLLQQESDIEIIALVPQDVSFDNKVRPLFLSREIIVKIENDHGSICPQNIILNAHRWEYATNYVLGNPDKINLIKEFQNRIIIY